MVIRRSAVTIVVALALAAPASAINNRSAVSVNGLDTNPCTPASPCRSFTAAIAQTNAGGEIIALDSAGYGPFTIASSMTVSGAPGVHAAITVTGGDAVFVDAAASDLVTVNNLTIIGPSATHAVSVLSAASVRVLNCIMTAFAGSAVRAKSGRVTVDHCAMFDNALGADIGNPGSPNVEGVITNSLMENNNSGVEANSAAQVSVANCTIVGGSVAVVAFSTSGTADAARLTVESSSLAFSSIAAVETDGSGGNNSAQIYLSQNHISYCPLGVQNFGNGVVFSYGNNRFSEVPTVGPMSSVLMH